MPRVNRRINEDEYFKAKKSVNNKIYEFNAQYRLDDLDIHFGSENQVFYSFELSYSPKTKEMEPLAEQLESKIRYMSDNEFTDIFKNKDPSEIKDGVLDIKFAIFESEAIKECMHEITALNRLEIYSLKHKCPPGPVSIVSIRPRCECIHAAPEGYTKAHYFLNILLNDNREFDKLKRWFCEEPAGIPWENKDYFPKDTIAVRLNSIKYVKNEKK